MTGNLICRLTWQLLCWKTLMFCVTTKLSNWKSLTCFWPSNCWTENNWHFLTVWMYAKLMSWKKLTYFWRSRCLEDCQSKNVWVTAWLVSEKVVLNNWPAAGLKISENFWKCLKMSENVWSQTIRFFSDHQKTCKVADVVPRTMPRTFSLCNFTVIRSFHIL